MKKMNFLKVITLLITGVLTTGCPYDPDDTVATIKIINNSDKAILWMLTGQSVQDLSGFKYNPFTTGLSGNIHGDMEDEKNSKTYIKAGDFYEYSIGYGNKESLKSYPLKYYLFDYDSVCIIPWDRISDERIILKEVVFTTWEEMEACGFTISYP